MERADGRALTASVKDTVPTAGASVKDTVPTAGASVKDTIPTAAASVKDTVPTGGAVSKNTHLVVAKTKNDDTGKAEEARKLNIPLQSVDEFIQMYMTK